MSREEKPYECSHCRSPLDANEAYEHRGAIACAEHFDLVTDRREWERQEIIAEEDAKTRPLKGLDLADNPIGRANREIMACRIEICKKESGRLKAYEGRE